MRFKGKLLLPGESGAGLGVNLDVAEHHLAVESDGGGLGAWPLEVVDVERLQGDMFSLTVAGEPLRFVADDTIAFAYTGVPAIEDVASRSKARSAFRSVLERIWNGPDSPSEGPFEDESKGEDITEYVEAKDEEPRFDQPELAGTLPMGPEVVERPVDVPIESEPSTEHPGLAGTLPMGPEVVERPVDVPIEPEPSIGPDAGIGDEPLRKTPDLGSRQAKGSEIPSEPAGCPAIRSDGRKCESQILTSSGYCYPHDPNRSVEDGYQAAQEARAQLRREGTARLNRVYARLDKAMRQVERGDLDPETAMAMAHLAKTMCAILEMEDVSEEGDQ